MNIPGPKQLVTIDQLTERMGQVDQLQRAAGRRKEIEDRIRFDALAILDPNIRELLYSDPTTDLGYYAPFDCWMWSATSRQFVEIKHRTKPSTAYPTWMIEEAKALELEDLAQRTNSSALLVTICPDRALVWNLNQQHEKQVIQCPNSTIYRTHTVPKQVRLYPTSTASSIATNNQE